MIRERFQSIPSSSGCRPKVRLISESLAKGSFICFKRHKPARNNTESNKQTQILAVLIKDCCFCTSFIEVLFIFFLS